MTKPTILVSTWGDGLFAVTGDGRTQEIANEPVRGLAPDGSFAVLQGGMPAWIEGIADTGCIAANDSSIAVVDRAGNLYGSDDFGRTWSCRSTGLPVPSGVLNC